MSSYQRIISQWCEQTGMAPWNVDDDIHVDIEGITVGLIYNKHESPETLHAYFDLGTVQVPQLHKRLLESNTVEIEAGNGYFGIHPGSGAVVYRVDIVLDEQVNGAELPITLLSYIHEGQERLASR